MAAPRQRRQFPRIRPNQPIPIRLPDGSVRDDLVQDISTGGMRLQCDRQTALLLNPDERRIMPENAPEVGLQVAFPVDENAEFVPLTCRICYVRGNVSGAIDIGVQFDEFEDRTLEQFQRFIEGSLLPAQDTE